MSVDRAGSMSDRFGVAAPAPDQPGKVLLAWAGHLELVQRAGCAERLDMTGCDLSGLQGAPLLADHERSLDAVLGTIEVAWIRDGIGWAIARFSSRPRAQEARRDVEDGILRHCSVAFRVEQADFAEDHTEVMASYTIRKFRPYEISIVPLGASATARIHRSTAEGLAQLAATVRAEQAIEARARRRAELCPDLWAAWATAAADRMAREFRVPEGPARALLSELVERQIDTMAEGSQ